MRGALRFRDVLLPALVGTPILFLTIEAALRLAGVDPQPRVRIDPKTCYLELEPGTHVRNTLNGLVHDLWIDSRGFRVSEAVARGEQTVPPSACRVLALGDSFTEGFFVTPEEAWPGQVERLLRERGLDVRVDNGGFRSRSIVDERFAALTRWAPLRHDLVVLEYTTNDIEDLVYAERDGCVAAAPHAAAELAYSTARRGGRARLPFGRAARGSEPPTKAECRADGARVPRPVDRNGPSGARRRAPLSCSSEIERFGCAGFGALDEAQYRSVWDGFAAELRRAARGCRRAISST